MVAKLALHCHRSGDDVAAAIRSAPWAAVKALDTTQPLAVAAAADIPCRILRLYGIERLDPQSAAQRWLSHDLGPVTHVQLCCEDARADDPAWQPAVMAALRSAGYRGRFLIGGYATGNPAQIEQTPDGPHFRQLEAWYDVLRQPDVDLAMDAYSGILPGDERWAQWARWTALRPQLILADLRRHGVECRAVVAESGADSVVPEPAGGGWQARGWTAEQYLDLLRALDRADQQDVGILCRCLFTLGAPPDWAPFEIGPLVARLAAYVTDQAAQQKKGTTMQGIDVSSAQPGTNWQQVAAAGPTFAAIKATEGAGYVSPTYAADWQGARAAGLVRMAYHFARPDLNPDAATEARYFLSHLADLVPGDLIALDLETGEGDLGPWAAAWFKVVDEALGVPALLYSYGPFLTAHGLHVAAVGKRPLWLAAYQDEPPPPPLDWPTITIWQHTNKAAVPGVAGPCDGDTTDLGADQLRALGKPAPAAPDDLEAEALAWFAQRGIAIDRTHAVWTVTLWPMYQRWRQLAAAGDPLADAYHLGPAVEAEYGTTFGGTRPAGAIKLTNAHLGAYLREDGTWRAFVLEL